MLRDYAPEPSLTGHSISNIRTHNLRALLLTLLREGAVSRVRLAQLTGLSSTTVSNLIAEMLAQGLVAEAGKEPAPDGQTPGGQAPGSHHGLGRPATLLQLVPSARCAAGLHIGVGNLRAGVADLNGELCSYVVVSHSIEDPPDRVLALAQELIERAITESGVGRERLVGLGVGASGLVDPDTGVNRLAPNLGWHNIPIGEILGRAQALPVIVDNNVRAMALAEAMFGAGRGVNTLAFVYGRVGVGAGFVSGGQVYRGSRAGAGEIGHTTMIPAGGAPCRCGNSGCLETLVSEQEIIRQARVLASRQPDSILAAALAAGDDTPPIERVFAAARAGHRETLVMLQERAFYTGSALANLVNLMNPDMIILGGLFAAGHDLMLPQIEETMRQRSFGGLGDSVVLKVTSFGRRVGVVGAAALALDSFFYRQEA